MRTVLQAAVLIISFAPFVTAVEVQTRSFAFNGVERSYKLGIPEASESTPSLVLLFHGATSNKDIVLRRTGIHDLADEFGIVVATPDAANDWFGGPNDSPEFMDALLDDIRTQTQFSDDGVGALGMSQGGIFSLVLAAERPNVIKAAANVSGGYVEVPLGSRPVPIIDIQGTIDVVAPYPGGPSPFGDLFFLPAIESVETFATHNQCDLTPVETDLPDIEPSDGSTVTLLSYPNCASYLGTDGVSRTTDVLHYRVDGGNHTWPGDTQTTFFGWEINLDMDATRVILEQFAGHTLATPEPSMLDFNDDSNVDVRDIDSLVGEIVAGTNDAVFDLSGEGTVDDADLTQWLSEAATHNGFSEAYLHGDSNLDGSVDATDLNNLALNWRMEAARWSAGDFKPDGVVDSGDLNELALNWRGSILPAATDNSPVPEPSAFMLTFVGLALICRLGRKRNNTSKDRRAITMKWL